MILVLHFFSEDVDFNGVLSIEKERKGERKRKRQRKVVEI